MMEWVVANKEWIFSGFGIAIPLFIVGWYLNKKIFCNKQSQKSGNNSTNIQVGKNFIIKK